MSRQLFAPLFLFCAIFLAAPRSASATNLSVTMAWSPVGNPGNAADPTTGYGAVNYSYNIGTYDLTVAQYTAFLNAVAKADTYGLYFTGMNTNQPGMNAAFPTVGIERSETPGNYEYSVIGNGNVPVFDVSWGDAARFANWIQNGEPSGAEGSGTTETGAYTLNGAVTDSALSSVTRNPGALYFLPTENEWYKAAYYKGGGTNAGYWLYPTKSNTAPSNVLSPTGTNNANYYENGWSDPTNLLTAVGAFADSPGPYGTYDMGGDVQQWNEAVVTGSNGPFRGLRGAAYNVNTSSALESSSRTYDNPNDNPSNGGFRLASIVPVPEPSALALAALAGVGLIGLTLRRRRSVV